ncbi:hypothetical protein [Helicobacter suis]|uniref:hypothetical protein n=1 Tax=Helicobacter suis TaxID=104628 RepID=UPI0013D02690|nr:hypothetical protein [Helicobacter suis]
MITQRPVALTNLKQGSYMRVYTRKDQLYAEYYTEDGKRVRKSLKLKDTEKNRARALDQLEARVKAAKARKRFVDPLEVPLASIIHKYLETFESYTSWLVLC